MAMSMTKNWRGPWVWRLGRIAWARENYGAIGGWRRLFWRLWWRETLRELPILVGYHPDAIEAGIKPDPKRLMHWSPDPSGMPMCGAKSGEAWTYELDFATCAACRVKGLPMVVQYRANTR